MGRFNSLYFLFVLACTSLALSFKVNNLFFGNKIAHFRRLNDSPHSQGLYSTANVMQEVEGFSQAFVGGAIGVMSVALYVEIRKITEKNLEGCPYCLGNGVILCGVCVGSGMLNGSACPNCDTNGHITCINCKGDGRVTPILLQSKATRNPEYANDGISIDSA